MKAFGYVNIEKEPVFSLDTIELQDAKINLRRTPDYQLETSCWKDVTKWVKRNPRCFNDTTLTKFRNIIFEKDIPAIRQIFTNVDGYDNYDQDGYVLGTSYYQLDTASWKETSHWIANNPKSFDGTTLTKFRDVILDPDFPPIRQFFNVSTTDDVTYNLLVTSLTNTLIVMFVSGCICAVLY